MVFSSHLFVFYFLPLVLLLNYTLPFRWLSFALMCVNFLFYGWANPAWLGLLVFSTSVDYVCGRALAHFSGLPTEGRELPILPRGKPRNAAQRLALTVSMVHVALPIGISFYTFQSRPSDIRPSCSTSAVIARLARFTAHLARCLGLPVSLEAQGGFRLAQLNRSQELFEKRRVVIFVGAAWVLSSYPWSSVSE